MISRKARMTVMVDRVLVEAANRAVASGRASSISTWVNAAMTERATQDRHLCTLAKALATYEAEFGEISNEELTTQQREDQRTCLPVRAPHKKPTQSRGRKVTRRSRSTAARLQRPDRDPRSA